MPAPARWAISLSLFAAFLLPSPLCGSAGGTGAGGEGEKDRGFHPERRVRAPGRLDWEFAAGKNARLPVSYDSRRQRYQLFVPAAYTGKQRWPLIVFVSPGDDPLGWKAWQKPCEDAGWLFAAAYSAGNRCAPAQRVRAVLDVLEDVRRVYRIDPERTYLAGLGGGSAVACQIAFHLPDQFAGVVVIGGDAPLPKMDYLRHRLVERLSVALVSDRDERHLAPLFRDLGVRSRLWRVPGLGHDLPRAEVLAEVQAWLDADEKRRREDRKERALEEETPIRRVLAQRAVTRAEALLREGRSYRGAALLEWAASRGRSTEAGETAGKRLAEVAADREHGPRLLRERAIDRQKVLTAQANALEKAGRHAEALRALRAVAKLPVPEGDRKKAVAEAKRVEGLLANRPHLGLTLQGDTTVVRGVTPGGPAARAGLRAGDRIVQVEGVVIESPAELKQQLGKRRPGDSQVLTVRRDRRDVLVAVQVAAVPLESK